MFPRRRHVLPLLAGLLAAASVLAQAPPDSAAASARRDYPFLSRSYVQVVLGGIAYNDRSLPDGYVAGRYSPNPFSGRLSIGTYLTDGLALQYGTLRAAAWQKFHDINDTPYDRTAWVNLWMLTLRQRLRLGGRLSAVVEGGLANVTRRGFEWGDRDVVLPNVRYLSPVGGLHLSYALDARWDLLASVTLTPRHRGTGVAAIGHYGLGAQLNFRRLVPRAASEAAGHFFPERTLRVGYGTAAIGFAVNELLSMQLETAGEKKVGLPVFWRGDVEARHTLQVGYERQLYRGRKVFALGWGASATAFQTVRTRQWVGAASVYPVLNFYFLRRRAVQPYVTWSVIGPTFLTHADLEGADPEDNTTGPRITYQDFIGLGAHLGADGRHNVEAKIEHYSNGNIFNDNAGVAVPVVFSYGWNW